MFVPEDDDDEDEDDWLIFLVSPTFVSTSQTTTLVCFVSTYSTIHLNLPSPFPPFPNSSITIHSFRVFVFLSFWQTSLLSLPRWLMMMMSMSMNTSPPPLSRYHRYEDTICPHICHRMWFLFGYWTEWGIDGKGRIDGLVGGWEGWEGSAVFENPTNRFLLLHHWILRPMRVKWSSSFFLFFFLYSGRNLGDLEHNDLPFLPTGDPKSEYWIFVNFEL